MNYIDVCYINGSSAILTGYKDKNTFDPILKCPAYVGKNGIDKQYEGDCRTPSGEFSFLFAFGTANKPDTLLDYIQITDSHYWCNDNYKYNQLIDLKIDPHNCSGEHLINYPDAYEYAIVLDYNKAYIPNKGSAIFLHCSVPNHNYTAGCIAVSPQIMLTILKHCNNNTKINIHHKYRP